MFSTQFIHGNGELAVLAAIDAADPAARTGADWLLLGPDVQLRNTSYDLAKAAAQVRATAYPQPEEAATSILNPPSQSQILESFTRISF